LEYQEYNDGEVEVRVSIRSDIDYLKNNLRDQDLEEMRLMGIDSPENALLYGFELPESVCYTLLYKGKISAMFGVVQSEEDEDSGNIWLLSTDEIKKFKKKFLKLAKLYVGDFKKEYATLFNLIHPSNTMSMKLVEILKAEFRWGFNSPKTDEPFVLFLI
jgi:hypothetical protein